MAVVVDTNVAAVAQGLAPQADQACIDTCVDRLADLVSSGGLLLDDQDAVVLEYLQVLGHASRPGVGRAFARWAWDNRFDASRVTRVTIRERDAVGWRRYEEFPDLDTLKNFDRDDQKFVAVARASGENPPILNAVDSDWWEHRTALADAGVRVEFICPQHRSR